jgi:hypothetical protein
MDTLKPRTVRMMFTASVIMLVISMTLSLINVANVLSAPLATVVTVPDTVGYEGYISGASGTQTLTFKIYDHSTSTNPVNIKWDQTVTGVAITNGLYSVALGGTADPFLSDTFTGNRWIGVTYNSIEQTPRTKITSVPFALNADSASKMQGFSMAGMIALFDTACPSPGWTEVASTQGRAVVGVPAGGQVGLQGGTTPLGNGENRTHTHTIPSHTHKTAKGAYLVNNNALSSLIVIGFDGGSPYTYSPGGSGGQASYQLSGTTTAWSGDTGTAGTFDVMPYVQLFYCKFTP